MKNEILPCRWCTCPECRLSEYFYQEHRKSKVLLQTLLDLLCCDLVEESKALIAARIDSWFSGHTEPSGGRLGELVINRFDDSYHPEINRLVIGTEHKSTQNEKQ